MCDASTLASISTGAQAVGTVASSVGAYNKSKADKAAYEYQAKIAENNAADATNQAKDAIRRGQATEGQHRLKVQQMVSSQRASMAARGLDLGEGSPLNILMDTETMGGIDADTIRQNASREAAGYSAQSENYRGNAELLRGRGKAENPLMSAGSTFLTGAGSVAKSWYAYKDKGVKVFGT